MPKRLKIRSKSYNKKIFRKTAGARTKRALGQGNAQRPHDRGGNRM